MNRRETIDVPIAAIAVVDRLRQPDPRAVAALQADIAERGLRQPIEIAPETTPGTSWRLVSGAHRLAACTALGWTIISAFEVSGTADELLRDELLENLARSELSHLERAIFASELRDLWHRAHPETRHGAARPSDARKDGTVPSLSWFAAAAERTGWSEATLQKAATIGSRLDRAAAELLRGTAVEHSHTDLYLLVQSAPPRQVRIASIVRERGATVRAAIHVAEGASAPQPVDPDQALLAQFERLWGRASDAVKASIRDHIAEEEA